MKLATIIARYKDDLRKVQRESAALTSNKVSERTPRDTGALRLSWTPSTDGHADNIDPVGTRRHSITPVINSLKPGDDYYFVNGQPYANIIEYGGHSPQAPHGMMNITIAEWQQLVNQVVKSTR